MRRTHTVILLILPLLVAAALLPAVASAQHPSLKQLEAQLSKAKKHRRQAVAKAQIARVDLAGALALQAASSDESSPEAAESDATVSPESKMRATLATSLLADGVVTDAEIGALRKNAVAKKAIAARWTKKVTQLQKRVQRRKRIARWNRTGNWWPLIKIAANKYGVSPTGLRRLMNLESGGRRYAGTTYKGLFQYHPGTWRGTWNPWRRLSIYNGWAQIRATAHALHRGMGPGHWPNTYPRAF